MKTVALFFGGPNNEHEVSIRSAKNIIKNFPNEKYNLRLIYWDKNGHFYLLKKANKLKSERKKISPENFKRIFDIAFPITHGKYGEDGVLQSILELQKIKYCGCHSLSSALCMDKILFKTFLSAYQINQVKFVGLDYSLDRQSEIEAKIAQAKKTFSAPWYVKPSNSGSSVGISKVEKFSQIKKAIKEALKHDDRVLIEDGLKNPKEIEVSVLGNKEIITSCPGRLKLVKDFYSYDDKYKLNQTEFIIPADISRCQSQEVVSLAKKVYKLCSCSGFARIDFFLANNKIYLNEINTIPGFTNISMYPMLMMNAGLSYRKLIEKIIKLAF